METTSTDLVTSYSILIIFPSNSTQRTFWKISIVGFRGQKSSCRVPTIWVAYNMLSEALYYVSY